MPVKQFRLLRLLASDDFCTLHILLSFGREGDDSFVNCSVLTRKISHAVGAIVKNYAARRVSVLETV